MRQQSAPSCSLLKIKSSPNSIGMSKGFTARNHSLYHIENGFDLFSKSILLSEFMVINLLYYTQLLAQLLYYKSRGQHPVHILEL